MMGRINVSKHGIADSLWDGKASNGDTGKKIIFEFIETVLREPLEYRNKIIVELSLLFATMARS